MTFLDNFRKEYIDKTAFIEIKNFYKIFFHFNFGSSDNDEIEMGDWLGPRPQLDNIWYWNRRTNR